MTKKIEELEGVVSGYHHIPKTNKTHEKLSVTFESGSSTYILNDPKKNPKTGESWWTGYKVDGPGGNTGLLAMLDKASKEKMNVKVEVGQKKGTYQLHGIDFGGKAYSLK